MAIPLHGQTGHSTYFITTSAWQKRSLFQTDALAELMVAVLFAYRGQGKYLLHEFVVMPTHFHLLITPAADITLERAIQLIKGGFSYRAARELAFRGSVWQTSFYDRRVREAAEYQRMRDYIHQNPVRRGLATTAEEYPYSSANPKFQLDEVPQRLKPLTRATKMQA